MDSSLSRAGKEHRVNTERYFHVMGQGWYVFTREGVGGPYIERNQAIIKIKQLEDPDAVIDSSAEDGGTPRWEEFFLR